MINVENRPWQKFYPEGLEHNIPKIEYNSIPELVDDTVKQYSSRVAFSNLGTELNFAQVGKLSDDLAAYLQQGLGLKKGDRIVIQMPNLLQYPVAMFAALKAGLVVVNTNPLYTKPEMEKVFKDSGAKAIIVLANFADKVEAVLPQTEIEHIIITQVADLVPAPKRQLLNLAVKYLRKMVPSYNLPQAISFRDALAKGEKLELVSPKIQQQDTAFLQYTGGTTGGTKAAVLSHYNLLANQYQFLGQMAIALGPNPISVIAALPLYHVFSLTVNCLGFFRFGAHNVLITNPRETKALVKTLGETKPEVVVLVSTLAGALLDRPEFAELDFSNLKLTVAGGMAVRTNVAERWKAITGRGILEGYGLTEASPVVSVNPVHLEPRMGTIGVPLPSTDVKIFGDDGKELPTGETGELAVKGPQVMKEYWNQPEETKKVLTKDGWLLTGDIAFIDEDGYITIVDRKKELIVVSGFNVYPSEIEDLAMTHPKVAEAGVIGIENEHSGEVPKAFIVKRDPDLSEAELREFFKANLAGYKRPKEIVFRDELPKTNVGKVLRRELK